jgi:hypothetical protein
MPADRPLHNVTRDRLLGIYVDLQTEPTSKKYNLRKELQTDRRDATVYANRWVTRDQFVELARQELLARGIELPATAAAESAPAPPVEPSPEQTAESLGPASDL